MHADRQAAGPGSHVVARQRALAALVEPAVTVKGKRMRGNDAALVERRTNAALRNYFSIPFALITGSAAGPVTYFMSSRAAACREAALTPPTMTM